MERESWKRKKEGEEKRMNCCKMEERYLVVRFEVTQKRGCYVMLCYVSE